MFSETTHKVRVVKRFMPHGNLSYLSVFIVEGKVV